MISFLKQLFLVKEIKSKAGELHFRRYRIFWTPWFALYIHRIYKSDEDLHPHSHPWNFISFILSGGYDEKVSYSTITQNYPTGFSVTQHHTGPQTLTIYDSVRRTRHQYHHITLISPVTSLVFTWGKWKRWGYLVDGFHVDFETYRSNKKEDNDKRRGY